MNVLLDSEQLRILNWRVANGGIGAVIGPPGCGKTTTGSALAVKLVAEGIANKVLLVAYTNAAVNEFGWELCQIMGPTAAKDYCLRTGNVAGIDTALPIKFSINSEDIRSKKIVLCTTLSLKRLSSYMRFDNMVIDEAGIERLEHLLAPLLLGVNQTATTLEDNRYHPIDNIIELASRCGIVATVIGDPKQSRPMGLEERDRSAIEWTLKYAKSDTLRITHRLPDKLSGLVDEFAQYNGLISSPDIAGRRLTLDRQTDIIFRDIIQPEDVITWVNIDGYEKDLGPTSWGNDTEARACAKICRELKTVTKKSIAVISRFKEQTRIIRKYLQTLGINDIKVRTTTGSLGTQADIVLFSLVRNNPERIVGAAGTLQDLNVAISRSKEKLIVLGSHDTMLNGLSRSTNSNFEFKSQSRRLAKLVARKYGKLIDTPNGLCN
jgi:hypothetical protein